MESKKLLRNGKKKSQENQSNKSQSLIKKYFKSSHGAIRPHLSAVSDLQSFLYEAGTLSLDERKLILEQALVLLEQNFVHLPLKKSMYGVDPVQQLKLIQYYLSKSTPETVANEYHFHRDLIRVFNSFRDLHTNYLLPQPFADKVTFLPFIIEEYKDSDERRYIVTHLTKGFSLKHFKKGAEIITWNNVPIKRAIEVSAEHHAGGNEAARHARGLDGLTVRSLRRALPPDELSISIGYKDNNGVQRKMTQEWLVMQLKPDAEGVDPNAVDIHSASLGIDIEADIKQRAKKIFFAPGALMRQDMKLPLPTEMAAPGGSLDTAMPGVFTAKSVTTGTGEYGYIRIFTFNVKDPELLIKEFIRLVELLPPNGLIIDVRGNGGGHIYASEGLLQTLTPVEITPEPVQFINTPLNAKICTRHKNNPMGIDLGPWNDSLNRALPTGSIYSQGYPITPMKFANIRGQRYHGPVVLITDGRCYSATDIFAAGFRDHNIGHILGVDNNTGAGGANVWTHSLLLALLQNPPPADIDSPYKKLPKGADMRVAIRRCIRVGKHSGTPLEDLGIKPDSLHDMTKNDLLNGNEDLINKAGIVLCHMPVQLLQISTNRNGETLLLKVTTKGITRLDVYLDDRPVKSIEIDDGTHNMDMDISVQPKVLKMAGFDGDEYVACRKIKI